MAGHQQQLERHIYHPIYIHSTYFPYFHDLGIMGTPPPPFIYFYHFNSSVTVYGGPWQVTPLVPPPSPPVVVSAAPVTEQVVERRVEVKKPKPKPRVNETAGSCSSSKRENKKVWGEVGLFSRKPEPRRVEIKPIESGGTKTTLMIKNIPNQYNRRLLIKFLDEHCKRENEKQLDHPEGEESFISAYDFLYLPIDFKSKCNRSYAFVNFTNPKAAWRFYLSKNKATWELYNSKKITEITYARIQGKDDLIKRFEDTTFACDNEDFLPVCFKPHRDGSSGMKWATEFNVWKRGRVATPSLTQIGVKNK
ncbi:hypothetical protein GIB67_029179 [Kingdonia uniflora]|uniref:Mei2-like C-terminal RNA recognition motif domain-containing protein n=1 Tax=Kingdonia uniflora TaxID=39325 RepID=A0A7J7LS86_9MAGN|nr:hypothetical protein GIB67_029179 [Kingdonia uniflora]